MLIELQEPFRSCWNKGYLQQHPSGRRYVVLFNSNEDRTIISYARYLMSVHIGNFIPDGFEVDHKDDDETNDDINNLQILTSLQNQLKRQMRYAEEIQEWYGFHCANCEIPFIITKREVDKRLSSGVEMAFCGRSCAASYHHAKKKALLWPSG